MKVNEVLERNKYNFNNGFMIDCIHICDICFGHTYTILVYDLIENKTNPLPFLEPCESFEFTNPKQANEQFKITFDYYKNFIR